MGKKKGSKKKKGAKKGPDDAAKTAAIKAELEKTRLTNHVTSLRKRAWDANSTAANKASAYQEDRDEQATKADNIQAELEYQALDFGKRCEKIDKARKVALVELEAQTLRGDELEKTLKRCQDVFDDKLTAMKLLVSQREMEINELQSAGGGMDKDAQIRMLTQQLMALEADRTAERTSLEQKTLSNKSELRSEMRSLVSKVGQAYKAQANAALGDKTRQAMEENTEMGEEMLKQEKASDHLVRHCTSLTNKVEGLKHDLAVEKDTVNSLMGTKARNEAIILRLREMVLNSQQECETMRVQLNEEMTAHDTEMDMMRVEHEKEVEKEREMNVAASQTNYKSLKNTLKMYDEGNRAMQKVGAIGSAINSAVDELSKQHAVRLRLAEQDYGIEFADSPWNQLLEEQHNEVLETLGHIQGSFRDPDQPHTPNGNGAVIMEETARSLRSTSPRGPGGGSHGSHGDPRGWTQRSHEIKNVRSVGVQVTALKINTGLRKSANYANYAKGRAITGLLRNTQTDRPSSAPASSLSRAKSSKPRGRGAEFASVQRLSRPRSAHAGHTNAYNNRGEEIPRYL